MTKRAVAVVSFSLFLMCTLGGCTSAPPAWKQYAVQADAALDKKDAQEAQRQIELMLAEPDKYGGKCPPMTARQPLAYVIPMQDEEEEIEYTANLRLLADHVADKALAEKMYRKALAVCEADYGKSSGLTQHARRSLIGFLKDQSRMKEAIELEEAEIADMESGAYRESADNISVMRAGLAEDKGDLKAAEEIFLKRVDAHKEELEPANLVKLKAENSKGDENTKIPTGIFSTSMLDDLARFYERHDMLEKAAQTRERIYKIKLEMFPDQSWQVTSAKEEWDRAAKRSKTKSK